MALSYNYLEVWNDPSNTPWPPPEENKLRGNICMITFIFLGAVWPGGGSPIWGIWERYCSWLGYLLCISDWPRQSISLRRPAIQGTHRSKACDLGIGLAIRKYIVPCAHRSPTHQDLLPLLPPRQSLPCYHQVTALQTEAVALVATLAPSQAGAIPVY